MTYAVGGLIQATDYNTFITTMNTGWAAGVSSSGYGQPTFTPVIVGDPVRARPASVIAGDPPTWNTTPEWRALVDSINAMSEHQSGAGTIILDPVNFPASGALPQVAGPPGGLIAWSNTLAGGITTVTGLQRLNAATQQAAFIASTATSTITWNQYLQATFIVTFASHDKARWFFNAGGQIGIATSHPAGAVYDIDQLISDLCSDAGIMWLSSTDGTPATITLSGASWNGITKVGGANPGGVITLQQNNGFYALGAALTSVFRQTSDFYYFPFGGTYQDISISYNGAGAITIVVTWDEVPDGAPGAIVSTGTIADLYMRYPSTTYLANSWGTATITNSMTGL